MHQGILAWPDVGGGDFKARKFTSVSAKYQFVRVEDDAIVATDVEPLNCLEEALGEIVGSNNNNNIDNLVLSTELTM